VTLIHPHPQPPSPLVCLLLGVMEVEGDGEWVSPLFASMRGRG